MPMPPKGKADYFAEGDYNASCFICGRKFKASQMKKNWQGFYTCEEDWTPRQPQDFVRGIPDQQTPAWTQPMPPDVFVAFCTPNGLTALVDFAIVDCVVVDYTHPAFNPDITEMS